MATVAQSLLTLYRPLAWLQQFLKEELAPYPGRTTTVSRMVIAATLVMIICMTFRIPYGFQGAVYALIVSRDNPRSTLESGVTIFLATGIGAAYVLISAWFVISVPLLHFLWIIASFFLAFYALSTMASYAASSTFAIMIAVGVPFWDRHVSAETNVEDTLWLTLSTCIGVVITAAVELAFARMRAGDDIVLPVEERLTAVESVLASYTEDRLAHQAAGKKVTRLALLGTSALRRALWRSDYSRHYKIQIGAVVALVGRLVDLAANLTQFSFQLSGADEKRFRGLEMAVANIRAALFNRRIPGPVELNANPNDELSPGVPLLREMEDIVSLIPQTFVGSRSMDEYQPLSEDTPRSRLFAHDTLDNPEHFKFALKGCLAASICYIIYNSIAWPGISTAVTTCLLTALSTIGSSRQKQVLRFGGAFVGGFLFGMGSQIFILPYLDSIGGFTLLFILVTVVAAWTMTASPRLSYFGLQIAVAFYLINVQEFAMQTSLAVARDRIVGILLGLFMMWLVFDQLWGAPAVLQMKKGFISTLRLLAQLTREPVSNDPKVADERSYSLRETISNAFDNVRASADGVALEFGASREQNLALRKRIIRWQAQLRILFLTRIALWKYRAHLPGFELPGAVRAAQQDFDGQLASRLDAMADSIEGKASERKDSLEGTLEGLEDAVRSGSAKAPQALLAAQVQTFLALSRSIENVTLSLDSEIHQSFS
jgi:multidrug resistance protein MdtO